MISVDLGEIGLDQAAQEATYRRLFERVRAYPGVERAALSMGLPFWSTFATEVRVHKEWVRSALAEGLAAAVQQAFRRARGRID